MNSVFLLSIIFVAFKSTQSQLYVVQHPTYLSYDFTNEISLKNSDLENLILSTSGFQSSDVEWKGLKSTKPMLYPKATLIFLSTRSDIDNSFGKKSIPLTEDTPLDFAQLRQISGRKPELIDYLFVKFNEPGLNLNLNDKCKSVSTFIYTIDLQDDASVALNMDHVIRQFYDCVNKNDLVVYLISMNKSHKRSVRQTNARDNTTEFSNLAEFYNANYPANFNIIFWISLVIALAVTGSSCLLWYMDPGSDTVIYRMTTQRLKKD